MNNLSTQNISPVDCCAAGKKHASWKHLEAPWKQSKTACPRVILPSYPLARSVEIRSIKPPVLTPQFYIFI